MAEIKTKEQAKKYFSDLKKRDEAARAGTKANQLPANSADFSSNEGIAKHENRFKESWDRMIDLQNYRDRAKVKAKHGVFDTGKK